MAANASAPGPDQVPDGWNAAAGNYNRDLWDFMTPWARELLEHSALAEDLELLDVAAGSGRVTVEAAPLVRRVLATDFAEEMLVQLESRIAEHRLHNVEVARMDGQDLDLPDGSFDRVVSNFGVIFFPDQLAGLREMHRVLRPGGRAIVTAWSEPERFDQFRLFRSGVRAALPHAPLPDRPPIFSLSDPGDFDKTLRAAGFGGVEIHTVTRQSEMESPEAYWEMMSNSAPPAIALLRQLSGDDVSRVREAVVASVRREKGDGPVFLSNEAHVAVAMR